MKVLIAMLFMSMVRLAGAIPVEFTDRAIAPVEKDTCNNHEIDARSIMNPDVAIKDQSDSSSLRLICLPGGSYTVWPRICCSKKATDYICHMFTESEDDGKKARSDEAQCISDGESSSSKELCCSHIEYHGVCVPVHEREVVSIRGSIIEARGPRFFDETDISCCPNKENFVARSPVHGGYVATVDTGITALRTFHVKRTEDPSASPPEAVEAPCSQGDSTCGGLRGIEVETREAAPLEEGGVPCLDSEDSTCEGSPHPKNKELEVTSMVYPCELCPLMPLQDVKFASREVFESSCPLGDTTCHGPHKGPLPQQYNGSHPSVPVSFKHHNGSHPASSVPGKPHNGSHPLIPALCPGTRDCHRVHCDECPRPDFKETRDLPDTLGKLGNYTIVPATWTGSITPGGPNVTLKGKSFMDIKDQLTTLNPDFDFVNSNSGTAGSATERRLVPRNTLMPPGCDVAPYRPAASIDWINGFAIEWGTFTVRVPITPGPRVCVEMGCAGNSGMWLCNDNPWSINPALGYLMTDYVAQIVFFCDMGVQVQGQVLDTDNYNVIVAWCDQTYFPF